MDQNNENPNPETENIKVESSEVVENNENTKDNESANTNNVVNNNTNNTSSNNTEQKAPVILRIVSFFIPLVGLIIYACNATNNKKYANSCGIPALIGFITGIILIPVFIFIVSIIIAMVAYNSSSTVPDLDDYYDDYRGGYRYYYDSHFDYEDELSEWKL